MRNEKRTIDRGVAVWAILFITCLTLAGCQSAYDGTREKFGVYKRDILVDRIEEARDSQEAAKKEFQTALERFSEVLNFKGGDLQDKYDNLNTELKRSEARADDVHKRIASVEDVAGALFDEWQGELNDYSDQRLRKSSEEKLRQTRVRYDQMIKAMKKAESRIEPVLIPLRDNVRYLKHELNARAIASIQDTQFSVEEDVAKLIRDMESSIAEANAFIDQMDNQ